ncbi:MAG: hypothetical protein ACN6O7_11070 [Sphingobacterium sp.]
MLYISAQPDSIYFIWQLEIQLRNFHSLGIKKRDIQVLIAYSPKIGLNPKCEEFMASNSDLANFYPYPDLRIKPKYTSSVRPHVLKQHFLKFPELALETFMYHDSDILFSRVPQIMDRDENDTCYVSDTRDYLDMNYVRSVSSEKLLEDMLGVVGLSKEKLHEEDGNTGGAQYILKGINCNFWKKVEEDSENLFVLMKSYNTKLWEDQYAEKKEYRSRQKGIQAWCSDMWAVLWNLWLQGKKVEIHSEMNFSWPYNAISDWNKFAIQHYSGKIEDKNRHFRKVEYTNYDPWYDFTLDNIPDSSCSYEIVKRIKSRRKELDDQRISFPEKVIFLETEQANSEMICIFNNHRNYIQKFFDIDVRLLSKSINEQLTINTSITLRKTLLNEMVNSNDKSFILLPLMQLINSDELLGILSSSKINQVFFSAKSYKIDLLFYEAFSKMLEIQLLEDNIGKFSSVKDECSILLLNTEFLAYYLNGEYEKLALTKTAAGITFLLP